MYTDFDVNIRNGFIQFLNTLLNSGEMSLNEYGKWHKEMLACRNTYSMLNVVTQLLLTRYKD